MTFEETYRQLKEEYPKLVMLLEYGDFFEALDGDAETVSEICETIMVRGPSGRPMSGFPRSNAREYVAALVNAGHRVGLAERDDDGGRPAAGAKNE